MEVVVTIQAIVQSSIQIVTTNILTLNFSGHIWPSCAQPTVSEHWIEKLRSNYKKYIKKTENTTILQLHLNMKTSPLNNNMNTQNYIIKPDSERWASFRQVMPSLSSLCTLFTH